MPKLRFPAALPPEGVERAVCAATIFLKEAGDFRLATAIFGDSTRRDYWLAHITAELAKANVHLSHCQLPETGAPRLVVEIQAHMRDVLTLPGCQRAVVVTGVSHHLPDAAHVRGHDEARPPFLDQANVDRELFPQYCPHPLLICVTPTSDGQFRRHAPDLMQWCSHTFDFTEPAMPDGSWSIRSSSELQHAQPGTIYANRDELLRAAGIFSAGLEAAIAMHGKGNRETIDVRANLANVMGQLNRTHEALAMSQENLSIAETAEGVSPYELANATAQSGQMLQEAGRNEEAEPLLRRALSAFESLGDKDSRAVVLGDIARILTAKGDVDNALSLHKEARDIFEAFGNQRSRAVTLGDIARILTAKGDVDAALALHTEARDIFEASGNQRSRAVALGDIARILSAKGDVEAALALQNERMNTNRDLGDMEGIAAASYDLAEIEVQQQKWQEAHDHLAESYAILLKLGRLDGVCMVELQLGQLLCRARQREQGIAMLTRSRDGFARLGWQRELQLTQAILDKLSQP